VALSILFDGASCFLAALEHLLHFFPCAHDALLAGWKNVRFLDKGQDAADKRMDRFHTYLEVTSTKTSTENLFDSIRSVLSIALKGATNV
jgi:hypothetical protein